jgi:hypothetical protein
MTKPVAGGAFRLGAAFTGKAQQRRVCAVTNCVRRLLLKPGSELISEEESIDLLVRHLGETLDVSDRMKRYVLMAVGKALWETEIYTLVGRANHHDENFMVRIR